MSVAAMPGPRSGDNRCVALFVNFFCERRVVWPLYKLAQRLFGALVSK